MSNSVSIAYKDDEGNLGRTRIVHKSAVADRLEAGFVIVDESGEEVEVDEDQADEAEETEVDPDSPDDGTDEE